MTNHYRKYTYATTKNSTTYPVWAAKRAHLPACPSLRVSSTFVWLSQLLPRPQRQPAPHPVADAAPALRSLTPLRPRQQWPQQCADRRPARAVLLPRWQSLMGKRQFCRRVDRATILLRPNARKTGIVEDAFLIKCVRIMYLAQKLDEIANAQGQLIVVVLCVTVHGFAASARRCWFLSAPKTKWSVRLCNKHLIQGVLPKHYGILCVGIHHLHKVIGKHSDLSGGRECALPPTAGLHFDIVYRGALGEMQLVRLFGCVIVLDYGGHCEPQDRKGLSCIEIDRKYF